MKASRFVSGLLAVSLSAASVGAFARHDGDRGYSRQDNGRHNDWRQRDRNGDGVPDRRQAHRQYSAPAYVYNQPVYGYNQPAYTYSQPSYAYGTQYHQWRRGDRLPGDWRNRYHVVNDWRGYGHLYAPPSGYGWVQADTGDYLLVALATGLIANLLMNR